MSAYQRVGFSKAEMVTLADALNYAHTNDGTLAQGDIDFLTQAESIIRDIRDDVISYETANGASVNPALVITPAVNTF